MVRFKSVLIGTETVVLHVETHKNVLVRTIHDKRTILNGNVKMKKSVRDENGLNEFLNLTYLIKPLPLQISVFLLLLVRRMFYHFQMTDSLLLLGFHWFQLLPLLWQLLLFRRFCLLPLFLP